VRITASVVRRGANRFVMPRGASPKRERQYKKIARKAKKQGRYKGREKRLLQESLTTRERGREKQKVDPVAKRKAPDEDAGSSRSGVTSVEDLNRRPPRTRRKRKDLDLESLRSLWLTGGQNPGLVFSRPFRDSRIDLSTVGRKARKKRENLNSNSL
jgi:hypothetical protein